MPFAKVRTALCGKLTAVLGVFGCPGAPLRRRSTFKCLQFLLERHNELPLSGDCALKLDNALLESCGGVVSVTAGHEVRTL